MNHPDHPQDDCEQFDAMLRLIIAGAVVFACAVIGLLVLYL